MKILNPTRLRPGGDGFENDKLLEINKQYQEVAEEVLSIAKAQIIVKMRFLDRALFELHPMANEEYPLATDGRHLIYDPKYLLKGYRQSQTFALRALTHMLMHSLFRHMFIPASMNQEVWDLSCDLAAESMVRELQIRQLQDSPGQAERNQVLDNLQKKVKTVTAEKLMRYFQQNPPDMNELQRLRNLFTVDEHTLWYQEPEPEQESGSQDNGDSTSGNSSDTQQSSLKIISATVSSVSDDSSEENENGDKNGNEDEQDDSNQEEQGKNTSPGSNDDTNDDTSDGSGSSGDAGSGDDTDVSGNAPSMGGTSSFESQMEMYLRQTRELEAMWRDISEHVQTDLETFAKQQGFSAGGMEQALRSLNRERYDYSSFLRKFATMHEVMRLSPDEYDYVYYTYGLNLYKDMPLIEPLEYRENKRIRDLVIAIDTSGSVQGTLVQLFLQKTYNILKQEETFDRHFNLHIIQCDSEIHEDAVIRSQEDFDQYIKTMSLHGFGGTDFRPVFEYVEHLRTNREFTNLKGLLYFTDGYGTYPSRQTDYATAFVFLDTDDEGQRLVPPWAIRIILDADSIES